MEKFILKINDLSQITVYSDIKNVTKKLLKHPEALTKTIPASINYCGEASNITESDNYIVIFEDKNKDISLNIEKNIAILFSPQNSFFFPDLVYLAIGMFANDLQKKGYYFLQSSVVKYDDEHSIMLLGDPNAGKTTMAYNLMKNNGYKLISNDNVLISANDGILKTHCGTKKMQMRYGGIKLYFPEILPFVRIDEEDMDRDEWDIKIYIDKYLKNNGYKYADESIVTDVYNITTYKIGDSFIRSKEKIDQILLMYEHLTKQIRSNRYALTGFNFPLPSFEDEKFLQDRYDLSAKICDNVNIFDARGTVDELSKRIVKKYEKK